MLVFVGQARWLAEGLTPRAPWEPSTGGAIAPRVQRFSGGSDSPRRNPGIPRPRLEAGERSWEWSWGVRK